MSLSIMNDQFNSNNMSYSNSLSPHFNFIKNFYTDKAGHYESDRFGCSNG